MENNCREPESVPYCFDIPLRFMEWEWKPDLYRLL